MKMQYKVWFTSVLLGVGLIACNESSTVQYKIPSQETAYLPGDKVLNNEMNWPPSPEVEYSYDETGYAGRKLSAVPAPGIHPRILMSPEDIPDVRLRLETTEVGQSMLKYVSERLDRTIYQQGTKYQRAYQALVDGDFGTFQKIDEEEELGKTGHWQNAVTYEIMLQSFIAMIFDDQEKGQASAAAIATWAEGVVPEIKAGRVNNDNGQRDGYHDLQRLGYTYDFAYNFMTKKQQDTVRSVISLITYGGYDHGMELPAHFRMWNWMNVHNYFGLLALAIEGEEGYDERIYPKAIETFKDYITYNYSKMGSSTEAAGYTTFGWRWGAPMLIAAARRGDHLATIDRYRFISKWHATVAYPDGTGCMSHGDGGSFTPGREEIQVMKYLYPDDPIVDYNWQNYVMPLIDGNDRDSPQIIAPMICAMDGLKDTNGKYVDYEYGKKLELPDTFFDEERGTLIARTGWDKDAVLLNMEARTDSFYTGHEHSDRGNFNLIAHQKAWAVDGFRSIESRYHNVVLIDGKGQGMWAPPADWMKLQENEFSAFGICNTKYAYDWFWPKGVALTDPADAKFELDRFSGYKTYINFIQENYDWEYETHPNVVKHFKGFEHPHALMWDEDGWTVRIPYNPVERAFRTAGLVKGKYPYVLVVDDIQKDDQVRLYEWMLMLNMETVALDITEKYGVEGFHSHPLKFEYEQQYTDILLGDAKTSRSGNRYRPKQGDPLLLVRVLHKSEPGIDPGYDSRPNIRVETFEKKDALQTPGARSFGLDRRLVVASRSVAPDFRILLYPHRHGDPLPETDFAQDGSSLSVHWDDQQDDYIFKRNDEGRTELKVTRY